MGGTWNDLLNEIRAAGSTHDVVRRKYLARLARLRGRNVIAYYSGWLQKPQLFSEPSVDVGINDSDKNGFMSAIRGMDRSKGLDLLLHTPGGEMAATESLVDYLRAMFPGNISVFVPQIALSAGTMIACAANEIWMGKESSLGPTDPQVGGGLPAAGILEEFERAAQEIQKDPSRALVWQPILAKLQPSAITSCEDAVAWSKELVTKWLETGLLRDRDDPHADAEQTVAKLMDKALNRTHGRHLSIDTARDYGLPVLALESDQRLQDAVLTAHHAFVLTISGTPAYKIIENQKGVAYIQVLRQIAIAT